MRWRKTNNGWTTQRSDYLGELTDKFTSRLQSHRRFWDCLYCNELLKSIRPLIPYGKGEVVIAGDSRGAEQLIHNALSLASRRDYGFKEITDSVRAFCDMCAPTVVSAGNAAFEVVLSKPYEQSPSPTSFYLLYVDNYRRRFGFPMQYRPERGWLVLDRNHIILFEMNKAYRDVIRTSMELLYEASCQQVALHKMHLINTPGYDLDVHQKKIAVSVYRATRNLGWTSSMLSGDLREPYQIDRFLTWCEFRIELREIVIEGLNKAIQIAGAAMGFDVHLEIRGLPTRADVTEARRRLALGESGRLVDLIEGFF